MNEGIQSNFICNRQMQKEGCYYLCLIKWASIINKCEYTCCDIMKFYYKHLDMGLIEADCFVAAPHAVLNDLTKGSFKAVTVSDREPDTTHCVYMKNDRFGHFNLRIRQDTNKGIPNGSVFTNWDPLDPTRAAASTYNVVSYRVLS
jgi:hypothetical protein